MGEWSEAIEDGVLCAVCKLPLPTAFNLPNSVCDGCRDDPEPAGDAPLGSRNNPFGRIPRPKPDWRR